MPVDDGGLAQQQRQLISQCLGCNLTLTAGLTHFAIGAATMKDVRCLRKPFWGCEMSPFVKRSRNIEASGSNHQRLSLIVVWWRRLVTLTRAIFERNGLLNTKILVKIANEIPGSRLQPT
jgi:hypothetical protein